MWWEYIIVLGCLGAAVAYCLWLICRLFGGKGAGCGSPACRCGDAKGGSGEARGIKIVPLVELRGPGDAPPASGEGGSAR